MNTNNTQTTNPTESWASTVSDYILQRRQQTKLAYTQTKPKYPSTSPDFNNDYTQQASKLLPPKQTDWLFKAVFIALAKQLEEGHTVLTLTSPTDLSNEIPKTGVVDGKHGKLYRWQEELIDILAVPLFNMMDESIKQKSTDDTGEGLSINGDSIFSLLNELFRQGSYFFNQNRAQITLSNHDRSMLSKRSETVKQLYEIMQSINSNISTTSSNQAKSADKEEIVSSNEGFASFEQFITITENNRLFNEVKNTDSLSDFISNNPIVYKVSSKNQNKTLTFWLHRTWQAEHNLAKNIKSILNHSIKSLDIKIPDNLNDQQVAAIKVANEKALSIITGGPGTGKTYTVAQLVIALQQAQKNGDAIQPIKFSTDSASLALAAPTGKAAQRMQESLQAALDAANVDMQLQEAKTIHRLLGIGQDGRPRYNADNPLGEDVIIVDEASMLGVEMANHLVNSIKPGARLILLGDANQLAAVDAGAVLADLCRIPSLKKIRATLTESRRFGKDSGIGKLAHNINQPQIDINLIWQLFREDKGLAFYSVNNSIDNFDAPQDKSKNIKSKQKNSLSNKMILNNLATHYQKYLDQINKIQLNNQNSNDSLVNDIDIVTLIATFNEFRILTAGHHGECGDHHINDYLTNWHKSELKLPLGKSPWFHGRPVMVLQNNYELGLFNGDIGFCLQTSRGLEVFFENKTQGIAVNLLNDDQIATAYAMTIHKAQGSEFDHVTITFDKAHSRLLSKELIYTAVTRAKKQVTIYSTKSALEQAVTTPTVRQTGLALQFEQITD